MTPFKPIATMTTNAPVPGPVRDAKRSVLEAVAVDCGGPGNQIGLYQANCGVLDPQTALRCLMHDSIA